MYKTLIYITTDENIIFPVALGPNWSQDSVNLKQRTTVEGVNSVHNSHYIC